MLDTVLFFNHYTMILLFGILLSVAFAGVQFSKKNVVSVLVLFVVCGMLQVFSYIAFSETVVWKLYPFITHLPTVLLLCLGYRKRIVTALAAVCSAYLCCQPAKWFGLLMETLTESYTVNQLTRIVTLLIVGILVLSRLSAYISEIYNKDTRSVLIFSMVPIIYYGFDYTMGIYTEFWLHNNQTAVEFLPFFLCIVYLAFCVIYYKEHEKQVAAERKEQIIRITMEQQEKEIQEIKKSELETRLLRHDMRLLLENLAFSIEQGDKENSLKMISGFRAQVESVSLKRYCENDTVNYILSNFESKCREWHTDFAATVEVEALTTDEIIFSSIISNALDNALNAQKELPAAERRIVFMLKNSNGKLLLSVKNPFGKKPVFVDGLPTSDRRGHGYGTQSIRYMAERLGGNCQFSVQNNVFVLRVVL